MAVAVASAHWAFPGWLREDRWTCFSPYNSLTYYDCCREQQVGSKPGTWETSDAMQSRCFDELFTYEKCCTYGFGPLIRGLPFGGMLKPRGRAHLYLGRAGQLDFSLALQEGRSSDFDGTETIWYSSWYFGLLMANLEHFARISRGNWDTLADTLEGKVSRPLRFLDLGCGLGVSSVAAARAGHNVTAVDIDPAALQMLVRNRRRNGVSDRIWPIRWDVTAPPPAALLARKPFDIGALDLAGLLVRMLREPFDFDALNAFWGKVLVNLLLLEIDLFLFTGVYSADYVTPEMHTSVMLQCLTAGGKIAAARRPCPPDNGDPDLQRGRDSQGMCPRRPRISPPKWMEGVEMGPPVRHALILW